MELIEVYSIYCATGCSCCSNENFTQGFYKTEEEAQKDISDYSKGINNPLGSQFARYGRYSLQTHKAELLGDGRMIIDDERVYDEDFFGSIYY